MHVGDPAVRRTAPHVEWVGGLSPEAPAEVRLSTPAAVTARGPASEGLTWVETIPRVRMTALPAGPTVEAAELAVRAMPAAPVPTAGAAPSLGFQGLTYADNVAFTGSATVPPDPDMAVGPAHVLGVTNVSIGAYDKGTGAVEPGMPEQSLQNFFGSATRTFDPKALYDPFDARYLVTTLEKEGVDVLSEDNKSRILIAASPVGTPVGTWNAVAIDAKITQGGTEYWCDYPGFAVDEEAVYVTCN